MDLLCSSVHARLSSHFFISLSVCRTGAANTDVRCRLLQGLDTASHVQHRHHPGLYAGKSDPKLGSPEGFPDNEDLNFKPFRIGTRRPRGPKL